MAGLPSRAEDGTQSAANVVAATLQHALHMMASWVSQREAARWSVTIDGRKLRVLFRARYFLAGVLIGAGLWLAAFLAMD